MLSLMGILNIEEDAAHFLIESISKLLILSKSTDALEIEDKAIEIGDANNTCALLYTGFCYINHKYFW